MIRIALIALLLAGCTTGKWADYNYGPGEWLAENTSLTVTGVNNYEKLWDPQIFVHVVTDLTLYCEDTGTDGCSVANPVTCHIYLTEYSKESTPPHERRHCHGWSHGEDPGHWYPTPGYEVVDASF